MRSLITEWGNPVVRSKFRDAVSDPDSRRDRFFSVTVSSFLRHRIVAGFGQTALKPLRKATYFRAARGNAAAKPAQVLDERFRIRRRLRLVHCPAVVAEREIRCACQGYVQSGEISIVVVLSLTESGNVLSGTPPPPTQAHVVCGKDSGTRQVTFLEPDRRRFDLPPHNGILWIAFAME